MTWTIHIGGHYQREDGTWDEELESEIAGVAAKAVTEAIEALRPYGLSQASFSGNHHQRNYLG